jgi:hypothetical protein
MSNRALGVPAFAAVATLASACATLSQPFPPTTLSRGEHQFTFSPGLGPSRWSYTWGPHASVAWRGSTGSLELAVDGEVEYGAYGAVPGNDVLTESLGSEVRLQALRAPISIVPLAGVRAILFGSQLEWAPEAGVGIGAESEAVSAGITLRAMWRNAMLRPIDGVLQLTAQAGVCWRPLLGPSSPLREMTGFRQGELEPALGRPKRHWSIFVGVEGGLETDHRRTAVWPEVAIGYGL